MKKLLVLTFCLGLFATSCGSQPQSDSSSKEQATAETKIEEGTLQVLYFHTKQRCITCKAIEDQTIAAVNELANKDVKLRIIDISSESGEPVAEKYEVAFSSLVLDNGAKTENLTDMAFRYARNEPETFKANLKEQIAKMLK